MPTKINFIKTQALGNDFVIIDTMQQNYLPTSTQIKQLSDRHYGIGFDQMLVISKPQDNSHDYYYQIFNADGSEVGQCGNGARCAALYIHRHLNSKQSRFTLKTATTLLKLEILAQDLVKLTLPCPIFNPQVIPLNLAMQDSYNFGNIQFHALSVGNPHAIIIIDSEYELASMDISSTGRALEESPLFPERCNVNFVCIKNPQEILLRVWERGCGETLACGSGALASAAAVRKFHQLAANITVVLRGGTLLVNWQDCNGPIAQIGPANEVFQGSFIVR